LLGSLGVVGRIPKQVRKAVVKLAKILPITRPPPLTGKRPAAERCAPRYTRSAYIRVTPARRQSRAWIDHQRCCGRTRETAACGLNRERVSTCGRRTRS